MDIILIKMEIMNLELFVFVVGLFLFTAYFWLEARREEKLTHEEKKREVMKQKSPIFYWGSW